MSEIVNIQSIIEKMIDLSQARTMLILHKGEVFEFFDEGCTRYVFVNKDNSKVVKILKENGFDFNKQELEIYTNASDEDKKQMAETLLIGNIIEQKYYTPIKFGGKKLSIQQRLFASSCRNDVGWNDSGELVCFDLDEYKRY